MTDHDDSRLESEPHVLYKMYDDERRLLYTGITCRLGKRIANHLHTKAWFDQLAYIAVSHYPSRTSALAAERRAIVTERPLHNVAHAGTSGDPFRGAPRQALRLSDLPRATIHETPVTPAPWPSMGDSVMHDFGMGEVQIDVGATVSILNRGEATVRGFPYPDMVWVDIKQENDACVLPLRLVVDARL